MDLNIVYEFGNEEHPLKEIKNNTLIIRLSSQYYIDQEEKKLEMARESFNDPMIDKQYSAFRRFKLNHSKQ